jgi:hypothetical protein
MRCEETVSEAKTRFIGRDTVSMGDCCRRKHDEDHNRARYVVRMKAGRSFSETNTMQCAMRSAIPSGDMSPDTPVFGATRFTGPAAEEILCEPPQEVAKAVGHPTIKPAANVLCSLGLISRWNSNEWLCCGPIVDSSTIGILLQGIGRYQAPLPRKHRGRCA